MGLKESSNCKLTLYNNIDISIINNVHSKVKKSNMHAKSVKTSAKMTSLTSQSDCQAAARAEPMALPMLQRSWAKIKQAQLCGETCASVKVTDEGRHFLAFKGLSFKRIKNENQQGIID